MSGVSLTSAFCILRSLESESRCRHGSSRRSALPWLRALPYTHAWSPHYTRTALLFSPTRLGTTTLPPFPRKLLWGSTSERVMHDRQSALDKYMQRVVGNQACGTDLVPFLELWRILPE